MKFNNKLQQQQMLSQGYDMRLQGNNMQYMGQKANNDINMAPGYDDYYEEDYDTEEAETYQQLINMKGGNMQMGIGG